MKKQSPKGQQRQNPTAEKSSPETLKRAVKPAEALARRAHASQRDRAGNPCITHVRRVAKVCQAYGPAAEAAAWLHDAVEDTEVTVEEVTAKFPPEVATIVRHLTRGDDETYTAYIGRMVARKNATAILVKLADLRDHAAFTPESLGAGLARRYDMAYERLVTGNRAARRKLEPSEMSSPFTRIVKQYDAKMYGYASWGQKSRHRKVRKTGPKTDIGSSRTAGASRKTETPTGRAG